jgi:nicotinic acid mononucleotide adenylyltransferase
MSNGDFDVHSFGAGAAGIVSMGAFAMAASAHNAMHEIVAERTEAERFAFIEQTIEDLLETNQQSQKFIAEQGAMIELLTATVRFLQVELTAAQRSRRP